MKQLKKDVLILGAGVTGLTLANKLKKAGVTFAVLEARDRVGGRLWTDNIEGAMLEIGGQWVSPDQDALIELLKDLNLLTFKRYRDGDHLYINKSGELIRYQGDIFPVKPETAKEIERLIQQIDAICVEIDPDQAWLSPHAKEYDAISFEAWLKTQTQDQEALDNISLYIAEAMITKSANTFSALQAFVMAASAGSFSHLVDSDFILDERVIGGLQQVPLCLAEKISDDVYLNRPVHKIEHTKNQVIVHTDGMAVSAKFAVLAFAPTLVSRISFEPPLPHINHQMEQHLSMGLVLKIHAVYKTAFWRDKGLSGTAFSPYQLVHEAYDNTNYMDERGTLVGFVVGEKAEYLLSLTEEERKKQILESMALYYGDETKNPEVFYISDWASEEWTRGGFAASFDIGGITRYHKHLRESVGRLHFTSSDYAGKGYQHVDGGIRMGQAKAAELIELLNQKKSNLNAQVHYVVGYSATSSGEDALALGVRLARSNNAVLHIVLVIRSESGQAILVPQSAAYTQLLETKMKDWLAKALAKIPQDIEVNAHLVYSNSLAEGLMEKAYELMADMIVIGTHHGVFGRFTIGSIAADLLHRAKIPIALAPDGYAQGNVAEKIGRITCAVGTKEGCEILLKTGTDLAQDTSLPLRLISLLMFDLDPKDVASNERVNLHQQNLLDYASSYLPRKLKISAEQISGKNIEQAMCSVQWRSDEVVLVGSSRLALPKHIFIGSTAVKMLRGLPVPMIVVPRHM